MKDSIKQILDKLKNNVWNDEEYVTSYKILFHNEVYELLDYIISLEQGNKNTYETSQELLSEMQEKIDNSKHTILLLNLKISKLEQENERLTENYRTTLEVIDKVIKYINDDLKDYHTISGGSANDLLEILKGE